MARLRNKHCTHLQELLLELEPGGSAQRSPSRRQTPWLNGVTVADHAVREPGSLACAPGITLTSESVFSAADALIVPTIPTTLSECTLDQLTGFISEHPPAPWLQRDIVEHLMGDVAGFLPTAIPNASVIE